MLVSRLVASELNALNREMHVLAADMQTGDWLRRSVPGTNLPAFIFWHIPRVIDSTVHMGVRGIPELIESEPWCSKPWARTEIGTGYTSEEADALAALAVPVEILEYADALRSLVSQWLRSAPDEELEAPNQIVARAMALPAYGRPALREALIPLDGLPAWLLMSISCFAHGWAHAEEIRLLAHAGRNEKP